MLMAAKQQHGNESWFANNRQFPQPKLLAYPLADRAKKFYEKGEPVLQRYMPFWAASLIDRLWVMLLPLVLMILPLMKVMPPIYNWRMRARVYRWYKKLESIDEQATDADHATKEFLHQSLRDLEQEVRQLKIPLAFAHEAYHLRQHIELVSSDCFRSLVSHQTVQYVQHVRRIRPQQQSQQQWSPRQPQ